MVPIAALAAMLIYVGYRLASPKTFFHAYKSGKDQLFVLVTTILVTLFTNLLIGIFAGIVLEIIINLYKGQKFKNLFQVVLSISKKDNEYLVSIESPYTFSNWISFENKLNKIPPNVKIVVDTKNAYFLDHSFIENIEHIKDERLQDGGELILIGIEDM